MKYATCPNCNYFSIYSYSEDYGYLANCEICGGSLNIPNSHPDLDLVKRIIRNSSNTPENKIQILKEYFNNLDNGVKLQECGHPLDYIHN